MKKIECRRLEKLPSTHGEAAEMDVNSSERSSERSSECDITFSRDYLTSHFGFRYGPQYFADTHHRVETDQTASRRLWERFGDLGIGVERSPPVVRLGYPDTPGIAVSDQGTCAFTVAERNI